MVDIRQIPMGGTLDDFLNVVSYIYRNDPAYVRGLDRAIDTGDAFDECIVVDPCIDRYLWALYQRTPKEDTVAEQERREVTVKKRGKMVTVTRTVSISVNEEFSWKDRKAAEHAGMPLMDLSHSAAPVATRGPFLTIRPSKLYLAFPEPYSGRW